MNMVVAADENLGIGYQGKLLVSIPLDHQRFRKQTINKVVVMGRKTLESLPQGQPLGQRVNVVLTTDRNYRCRNAVVVHSMEEALEELKKYSSEDIYIIGGESIYRQFMPYVDTIYMTKIDYAYLADVHFPEIDPKEWEEAEVSDEQTYFDLIYYFCKYVKKNRNE
ncbi:MAG: dihydrofolate reductase [Lachnospiraceae bacterium]|nr:dihydrofolate reductase [Lachnospiraceae bacterium]